MIHEAKGQGNTIEEALANAKKALNAPADADVHCEMITMPTKKFIFKKPGEARAWYETPDAPAKKPEAKQEAKKQQRPAPKQAQKQENKPAPKQKAKPQPKAEAEPKQKSESKAIEEAQESTVQTEISLADKSGANAAAEYLVKVVKGMGVENASVKAFLLPENEILLELDCADDYGIVIGRRGETLDSIQYLTRLVAGKHKSENEYSRLSINVGNYREKRKQSLCTLAKNKAERVLRNGRNMVFEPMNPYERRIIHTAVQEIEGVTSYSVGTDADRRVVISLAEGVKPTHPSKGGYNGKPRQGGRGGRGGYKKGGNYNAQKSTAPQRAPKTDAGAKGVSLYGKIN